ncbi:GTA head formation protein, RCAP_rcc01685 family [Pararhodobacter oceanensis]|uniref:GTA head formation protein, RCAP_rcc01685 family n=1 Tax=Pararhodobacter oceanensis TaxID=2172121 RepID=UPI003A93DECF
MTAQRRAVGGSRFLYDSFDLAQARIDAQERLENERRAGLEYRLNRIEEVLERLERRLWLAVFGVASGVIIHGALALIAAGY